MRDAQFEWTKSVVFAAVLSFVALSSHADENDVPRTRTLSGLAAPAFEYVKPESVGLSSKKLEWIGDEIVSWIANGELVGGELLIVKDEKAVFHEAYGWSDRERKIPVRRNSIWSIKGMSIPFTTTAVLMLAEQDKLSLDDPVSHYISWLNTDEITIHHLLSHTSGFMHDDDWYDSRNTGASLNEMVENWPHRIPEAPIGEFHYASFNYAALGYIVGKVAGTPTEDFISDYILRQLRLDDTSPQFTDDPAWRSRLNPWYRWNEQAGWYDLRHGADDPGWTMYPVSWGLLSTTMDYATFIAMWLHKGEWAGRRLLSDTSVELALTPHGIDDESFGYGYGWYLDRIDSNDLLPFALWGGDGTQSGAYPDQNAIVVFLTHSRWGPWYDGFWNRVDMSGVFEDRAGFGMHSFMTRAETADVDEAALTDEAKRQLVGQYVVTETATEKPELRQLLEGLPVNRENMLPPMALEIWIESGHLQVRRGKLGLLSAERFNLVPTGRDRFLVGRYDGSNLAAVEPDSEIRFVRDDSGIPVMLDVVWKGEVQVTAQRIRSGGERGQ
jgi:CubicO group peptidase (beta-lactamase class C family)